MKKRAIHTNILAIACLLFLSSSKSFAQQDPHYTQYMFNPLGVNAGYTGSREALSAVLLHRSQWVGFDGAPSTQTLALHSPMKNTNMGLGLLLMNDVIGPHATLTAAASYAYRIKLGSGKLAFGLKAGIQNHSIKWDKIEYKNPNDNIPVYGVNSITVPNFDFGMYYNTNTFYAGLEIAHLNAPELYFSDSSAAGDSMMVARMYRHATFILGKAFRISDNVVFKPSIILKGAGRQEGIGDLNLCFLMYNKLWAGIFFRSKYGPGLMVEYNITPQFRLGYAYDVNTNGLTNTNSGSHEIFIGYDFIINKSKVTSPRYF